MLGVAHAVLLGADTPKPVSEYITTPEAHGWSDGNTLEQNRAAFAAAIADASANAASSSTGRGVVELVPGKVYWCMPSGNGGPNTTNVACAVVVDSSNIEIRTHGKPLIGGNQAILRFDNWAGYSSVTLRGLVRINASNVLIGWVELDGNKLSAGGNAAERQNWLANNVLYGAGNGGFMNLCIYGGTGIRLKEVNSHSSLVDGLFMRGNTITDFLAEDCDIHHNRRQGMTFINAGGASATWDQVVFRRVKFRETGDQPEMVGERPGANVDMEPLQVSEISYGLTFDAVEFLDSHGSSFDKGEAVSTSAGRGLVSDTHASVHYFKMLDCISKDNRGEAYRFNLREGADFINLDFQSLFATGNGTNAIHFNDADGNGDSVLTGALLVNCNVAAIVFFSSLAPTGNDVVIWKGGFNPTVTTNGIATITVHNGFPS